jgi:class 3 adenylate cyclase
MESFNVYIPMDRRIALSRGESLPDRTRGSVLFADVSGFTPLTEMLVNRLGPERGAEEVIFHLNRVYEAIIGKVDLHGGSVISFGGDAITCWFDGDDGRRALTSAFAMQDVMTQFKSVKTAAGDDASFHIKASVVAGNARRFLVGNPRVRSIEALAGKLLDRVAGGEKVASQREVVVGPEIVTDLHLEENVVEWRTGGSEESYAVIRSLKEPASESPWETSPVIPTEQSRDWLLPAIYDRLIGGGEDYLAELRPVVAVFLKFTGIDYDTDNAEELLDKYIRWVQDVVAHYEGILLELVIGDKGSFLYMTFGALQAHEDDAVRAAGAALELVNIPDELRYVHPPQIGISLGLMRTGSYGSRTRRSYAAQGQHVNLSSRLMSKANPGQILASQVVMDAANRKYQFEHFGEVSLKGVSQPVPAFELKGQVHHHAVAAVLKKHTQTTIFGREKERGFFAGQLNALRNRENVNFVLMQGEAGIGKSRLVADLVESASAVDIPYLIGSGDAIEKSTPYLAWRSVFTKFFGLEGITEHSSQVELDSARNRVLSQLSEIDPSLVSQAPLLNAVLHFNFPDNETTSHLSGEARANQTQDVCISLLKQATAKTPHLLVMEDAHWLDSASWVLLRLVSRDVSNLLVVVAMRPVHDPVQSDLARMMDRPNIKNLSLDSLSASEIETLICHRLDVQSLPSEISRFIRERAEGHPFFSEELAYALRDTGLLTIADGVCHLSPNAGDLRNVDFPDTIDGVIISRIDTLPAQEQLLLKVASVVGRIFAMRILLDIHPVETDKPKLPNYLSHLDSLDITPLESPEPDLSYIFKHIITQEVAYNLMLFAQRRELHRVVAEWFEGSYTDDMSSVYPLLVHHWKMAENPSKTVNYLGKAGEQAATLGANQEVINFLMEAIELNKREKIITDKLTLADWEQKIGYALLSIGHIDESIHHLSAALAHLGRHVPKTQAGYVFGLLGQVFRQTMHRLWSSRFMSSSREPELCLKATQIFQDLGVAVYHTSNPIAAIFVTISQLNEAEVAPPSGYLATSYGAMAVVAGFVSPYKLAPLYVNLAKKALPVASRQEAGYASELLAMYNLGIGNWREAETLAEEAYHVYANTGNFRRWEELTSIYSSTLLPQGQVERSFELRRELEALSLRAENPQSQVWAVVQQAEIFMRQDQLGDALPLLEKAVTLVDKIGSADQLWAYGVLAQARLWNGEADLAKKAAALSYELILKTMPNAFYALEGYAGVAEVGITQWDTDPSGQKAALGSLKGLKQFAASFPIGGPRALLWEGMYYRKAGNHKKAQTLWQKGLTLAQEKQYIHEEGLLRRVIAEHIDANDPERKTHLRRAVELHTSIGATHAARLAQSALTS